MFAAALNIAKTKAKTAIFGTLHPPVIRIANDKYPIDCTVPLNIFTLNRKIPPASPAIADESNTAIHWYLNTEIPWASTALGFSPTALNLKPILVLLTTTKIAIAIANTAKKIIMLLPNNELPIGKHELY